MADTQCVWFKMVKGEMVRCQAEGTVRAGMGAKWWRVCRNHVRWFSPSWMPTWWYWLSPVLIVLVVVLVAVAAFVAGGAR